MHDASYPYIPIFNDICTSYNYFCMVHQEYNIIIEREEEYSTSSTTWRKVLELNLILDIKLRHNHAYFAQVRTMPNSCRGKAMVCFCCIYKQRHKCGKNRFR